MEILYGIKKAVPLARAVATVNADKEAKVKDIELAYAAGVIDADGSIGIGKHKRNGSYWVAVQLTDRRGLLSGWLKEHFGGTVSRYKSSNSFITGGYYNKWAIHGSKAVELISIIAPYLVEKSRQAQIAINFPTSNYQGSRYSEAEKIMREAMFVKMGELNQA